MLTQCQPIKANQRMNESTKTERRNWKKRERHTFHTNTTSSSQRGSIRRRRRRKSYCSSHGGASASPPPSSSSTLLWHKPSSDTTNPLVSSLSLALGTSNGQMLLGIISYFSQLDASPGPCTAPKSRLRSMNVGLGNSSFCCSVVASCQILCSSEAEVLLMS